jgi:Anti-sigma-K factor rskA/Putative zinc-finger
MSEPASPHVEVAAYLLGKLEADEAGAFEAHLAGCPDCRRQLEELQSLPELLATATPAVPLPDALRDRTLAAVRQAAARAEPAAAVEVPAPAADAPAPAAAAPAPVGRRWWRRRWLVVAVAAAALVAALAVPGALLLGGDGGEVTRLTLVAAEAGGGRGQVTVTRTAAGRSFDVRIRGLPPPPPGSLYELWAVHPQDTLERPQRVSLGSFTTGADGSAHLTAFTAAPADRFPIVGVTLEPVDGNPARTGARVLVPGPSG